MSTVKKTDKILFVKIENDGFDLGAQRKAVKNSDLPTAMKRVLEHKDLISLGKQTESTTDPNIYLVGRNDILNNGDYNLSGEKYKVNVDMSSIYPIVSLQDVCVFQKGSSITKRDVIDEGIPVIAGGQTPAYFHNKFNRVGQTITVSASGAYSGFVNYFEIPIFASDCFTIKPKSNLQLEAKFVYHILKFKQEEIYKFQIGGGQPHVYPKHLEPFKIPLPPLPIQKSIVDEIISYQKIIDGARQVVENYKPRIDIDPAWDMVILGKISKITTGGTPSKSNDEFWKGSIPWVSPKDMKNDFIFDTIDHVSESAIRKSSAKLVPPNTILCVVRSGILKHTIPFALTKAEVCYNQDIISIICNKDLIDYRFVFYYLKSQSDSFLKNGIKTGVTVQSFRKGFFHELLVPLPPKNVQKEIVDNMEFEQETIARNKKLMVSYRRKIKDRVAKVWRNDNKII